MGSIVIFRISSCPPLFVVYQYHTCNWFYFSYFLLYFQEKQEPSDEVLRLKMTETVQTLLNTTRKYIPILFDFAGECRMNVIELLRKPVESEIKWQELKLSLTAN